MNLLKQTIAIATVVASFATPALANAAFVPPGNSAATQYTETFPTSGGNVEVNGSIDGGGSSPSKKLPPRTTHALESHGEEGEIVAALASESGASGVAADNGSGSGSTPQGDHKRAGSGAGTGNSGSGGSGGSGSVGGGGTGADQATGSSGAGQVLSSATFSSSGQMGIFLPLVLIAALAWAVAFAWRRRQHDAD